MLTVRYSPGLREEYRHLFATCIIDASSKAEVDKILGRIEENQTRYATVAKALSIPWYVIAVIHSLESSLNFRRHLHNGDPVSARTV